MKSEIVNCDDGTTYWVIPNTKIFHREDGPAVEHIDGSKWWYVNGELHREDGPAVEQISDDKYWYQNGELHREDGPAVENNYGYKEYWLNNQRIIAENDEEFERILKLKGFM